MQSIFSNALSESVAKHIDLSVTRRETLSWLALLIMQHGTISLWRLAAYVASAAQIASVRRRFYRFFQFVRLDSTLAAGRRQTARPRASPNRTQSPLAPRNAQRRHIALPSRCDCSLHQQSGRTRRAHDEASSKNLGRLSLVARRNRLRAHPLLLLHRQEAGLEYHRRSDPRPIELGQISTPCVSLPDNLGSYKRSTAASAAGCEESGFVVMLVMAWSPVRRANAG